MLKLFHSQENRRECYMVIGLICGTLTFTHWVWGWPVGVSSTAQDHSQTGGGVFGQIPWRQLLEGLPLLALGLLYYMGRRHGSRTPGGASARDQIISECDKTIKKLQQRLTEVEGKFTKSPWGTLTIHSAEWIPVEHGLLKNVGQFIRENVKETLLDSVSMRLINSNLGGDPEKDTHKILKLSYSYGSDGPHEIVKDEDEWLVLPEPRVNYISKKGASLPEIEDFPVPDALNLRITNTYAKDGLVGEELILHTVKHWEPFRRQWSGNVFDQLPHSLTKDMEGLPYRETRMFQLVEFTNRSAPIIRWRLENGQATQSPLPGHGIWQFTMELRWAGGRIPSIVRWVDWNNQSLPMFCGEPH